MANHSHAHTETEHDDEAKRKSSAAQSSETLTQVNDSPPGLNPRQAAVLKAQQTLGNGAVVRMLKKSRSAPSGGARTEGEDDQPGGAPAGGGQIESDSADNRKPAGGGTPAPSGAQAPAAQQDEGGERTEASATDTVQRGLLDTIDQAVGSLMGWYPPYSQIIADATVKTAMDAAWANTEATATATQRREEGFWVLWDKSANTFSVTGTDFGPWCGPTVGGSVNLSAKPADTATVFPVASFHTHTPTAFRTVGRPVGPSSADNTADTSDNVTGIVYDYVSPDGSGNIPAGHPIGSAAQLWHSGPNRRS